MSLPPASGKVTAWHIRFLVELGWSDPKIAAFFGRSVRAIRSERHRGDIKRAGYPRDILRRVTLSR